MVTREVVEGKGSLEDFGSRIIVGLYCGVISCKVL
jgi:hypothetical protein